MRIWIGGCGDEENGIDFKRYLGGKSSKMWWLVGYGNY